MKQKTLKIFIGLLIFLGVFTSAMAINTQDFVNEKIVNAEKLCYVMSEKPILVNDYQTMRDVYSQSSDWNVYPMFDQWTLNSLLERNKVEISSLQINNKSVIVFRDYGADNSKSESQVQLELNNELTQLCMLDMPRTRAYHSHAKAPSGGTQSFVKILGLINGHTYGRNDLFSVGLDGNQNGYTINIFGTYIDLSVTLTTQQLNDMGLSLGTVYDINLASLPDSIYHIIAGETYTLTVTGDDGSSDTNTVSFENP